ncbi:MAG: hypothetical protein GY839_16965 [candidate division Zixibacteria bacterium]|nr:hypothetical protein [candidate division Zixibacteria bacterium]
MSTVGIIDIGTNTILSVKASAESNKIIILSDNRYHYRAGRRLDDIGNISSEYKTGMKRALSRALNALGDCPEIKIIATEVLRKPKDGQLFADELAGESGYTIEIINPQREAELSFKGATYGLDESDERITVIDIGGGSTELAVGIDGQLDRWSGVKLGAVTVCETVGSEQSPVDYLSLAGDVFSDSDFEELLNPKPARMIVVGGSAVAIAAILADLKEFDAEKIQGFVINRDILTLLLHNLGSMSIDKRRSVMPFDSQRADIIVGGGAIILAFMRKYGFETIEISTNGLRHGYLLEHFS